MTDRVPAIELRPVGIVRSQIKESGWSDPNGAQSWDDKVSKVKADQDLVAELVIDRELQDALDGIEGFSHLLVLYWPHLLPAERRSVLKVHPTGRTDFPLVGVFATRSPARPNMVLTTVVRLLERKGNILRVTGLDAIDGSPLLDIKPYTASHHDSDEIRMPAWMEEIRKAFT